MSETPKEYGPEIDAEVPEPIILWQGTVGGVVRVSRVVATLRDTGPPEEPPGWYVTAEDLTFDALAKPAWRRIPRMAGPTDEYEVNPDYTIVLETALGAIAERTNRVREKVRAKK